MTKKVRLTIYETFNEGDPWYKMNVGEWVAVWCPRGYTATSGAYDWVYPTWQSVTGSKPAKSGSRNGWQFLVQVQVTSTEGQLRGHLYAICRSD